MFLSTSCFFQVLNFNFPLIHKTLLSVVRNFDRLVFYKVKALCSIIAIFFLPNNCKTFSANPILYFWDIHLQVNRLLHLTQPNLNLSIQLGSRIKLLSKIETFSILVLLTKTSEVSFTFLEFTSQILLIIRNSFAANSFFAKKTKPNIEYKNYLHDSCTSLNNELETQEAPSNAPMF